MNTLYADLAEVYEAMYRTFIDYEAEFAFYAQLIGRQAPPMQLWSGGQGWPHEPQCGSVM